MGKLPEFTYATLPSDPCQIVLIKRHEEGYYPYSKAVEAATAAEVVKRLNDAMEVTPAQREAMIAGSMFGWHCPGADPDTYDERGIPKRELLRHHHQGTIRGLA